MRFSGIRTSYPLGLALLTAAVTLVACARSDAAEVTPEQARAVLNKATAYMRSISAGGGYLWRYSEDLKQRAGENTATETQVWIQPPGTPSVGTAFLRAYEVTKDAQYLGAAEAAALGLARGQLASGGWDYLIDFDAEQSRRWYRRTDVGRLPAAEGAGRRNTSTFDDDNTQSAVRFLMAFVDASKGRTGPTDQEVRTARDYALTKMLECQYPNGAWPQRYDGQPRDLAKYPVQPGRIPQTYPREYSGARYFDHYTLNDQTQSDCITTMLEAYHRTGKPEYLASAKKGGDFLILAQLPAPQSSWAQQYNAAMEPAWARAFEPASVCSGESAGAIRTLVRLYHETGDDKYLKPIPAAIDWFKRSEIAPGTWARFYELHTNKPIYGDRDGKIHYTVEELTPERQRGYAWRGPFGVAAAIAAYEAARKSGPVKPSRAAPRPTRDRLPALEAAARQAIEALDDRGRWLERGQIQTRTFIRNLDILCDYLAAAAR